MAELMPITPEVSPVAWLPAIAVGAALLGALAVSFTGSRSGLRTALSVATCSIVFGCFAALYGPVYRGVEHAGERLIGVAATLASLGPMGLTFRLDPTGLVFALITALVWLLAMIFGSSYMQHEHAQARFAAFMLLTLAGDIGVLIAGDYVTLFVFFEIMAVASYVLVIHGENPQSMRAGRLYFIMSVAGGLILLGGIVALFGLTGDASIAPEGSLLAELPRWLALGIPLAMVVGFATKAGMFFLHVWLPEAHPVAPSPASALLSGLMVKVGVYGILRTATILLIPGEEAGGALMHVMGLLLMFGAVATMIVGMVDASFSSNTKELLAFSTISQVGYILLGVACAAYLGAEAAVALTGVLVYVVGHAAAKAMLFLTIGAVMWRTGEQHLSRLGGLARKMPWTAAAAFLAAISIIGMPGTAGFAGKSLVHEALLEVIGESAAATGGAPQWEFLIVDALFVGVAAGTFAYMTRLFVLVFMGKLPKALENVRPASIAMRLSYVPLAVVILFVGLLPNKFIEWFVGPALAYYGLDVASESYHHVYDVASGVSTLPILYDPAGFSWVPHEIVVENLLALAGSVFFAGTFFLVGNKIGVFEMPTPEWAGFAVWYRRAANWSVATTTRLSAAADRGWDRAVWAVAVTPWLARPAQVVGKAYATVEASARALGAASGITALSDRLIDRVLGLALVDAWLSEPEGVSRGAPDRPPLRVTSTDTWAPQTEYYTAAAWRTVEADSKVPSRDETDSDHGSSERT